MAALIRRGVTNFVVRFRKIGPRASLAHYHMRLKEICWEWSRGVNTRGYIPTDPEHVSSGYHHYTATRIDSLRKLLKLLNPNDKDVFIDYGSGLGRVILVAAGFGFAKTLGIEISEEQYRISIHNLSRYRGNVKAKQVEFLCANAAAYRPTPDINTFYFNSPFSHPNMLTALGYICESLVANPRPATIIFRYVSGLTKVLGDVPWLNSPKILDTGNGWVYWIYRLERIEGHQNPSD